MHDLPLISTIAAGFAAAWVLGLLAQWLRLSPIVGYLLAGIMIGPYTPGFRGDVHLAHQLSEIGVILLMFGVGLHFHLKDLMAVKGVAIPGAIGQSLAATLVSMAVFLLFDIDMKAGSVIGMAMAVASTVVLMRVLMDADVLSSPAGHVAVGWLLVEDVLTVIVLVMIPVLGSNGADAAASTGFWSSPVALIGIAILKLAVMVVLLMVGGSRVIPWVLTQVARLRSRELFTLTVLVFSIAIAAGAYAMFGASMALGAFLAGMVVAQSPVSHQAAADALPLRDAFAVLFFVAVGMLFDPMFLIEEPLMMLAGLGIILLVKPLVALVIVITLGHSVRTALTVAIGLAQIGEFSFILSDAAHKVGIMPDEGRSLLVGGAILSITINPILFRSIGSIERWLMKHPRLWKLMSDRSESKLQAQNATIVDQTLGSEPEKRLAIVVGFGPVGQTVDRMLRNAGLTTIVIDMNMDTVADLRRRGQAAIFGDASRDAILESAGIERATHFVVTLPHAADRVAIVATARNANAKVKILVRAHYLREREELEQVGASAAIFEEAEAAVALARLVLVDAGAGRESIEHAVRDIRMRLILDNVSKLRSQSIRSIMIPWTRVRRLSKSSSLDVVRRQVNEQHFSRWPVVDHQDGKPVGYLLAKDLIGLSANVEDWSRLIRPLGEVHPDDNIESMLLYFQQEETTLCVVADQGRPAGIVTFEDVIEQMIGRMEDEYPRHPKVEFNELLWTDDSLLNLQSTTAEDAIREIASMIPPALLPAGIDIAELAITRERELSTAIGMGVAIPHARCASLARPLIAFARSKEGVRFDVDSTEPVNLIFLLITPQEQPQLQLYLLGQVASIAGKVEKLAQLRQATSAAEVMQLFPAGSLTVSSLNS